MHDGGIVLYFIFHSYWVLVLDSDGLASLSASTIDSFEVMRSRSRILSASILRISLF